MKGFGFLPLKILILGFNYLCWPLDPILSIVTLYKYRCALIRKAGTLIASPPKVGIKIKVFTEAKGICKVIDSPNIGETTVQPSLVFTLFAYVAIHVISKTGLDAALACRYCLAQGINLCFVVSDIVC